MIRILGVMTGTSCDGLDASCIEVQGESWKELWSFSAPYPSALRKKILALQLPGTRRPISEWLRVHAELGAWYGTVIARSLRAHSTRPDLIANHGQTVAHFPNGGFGTTLQLGDPTRIASATGISVASNFRDGDLAAGGQGAPLAPRFHQLLARNLDPRSKGVSIHNIGGISNLSYIHGKELLAFDTGPGNIWIDAATALFTKGRKQIDLNGKIAAQGVVDVAAVRRILKHPYFSLKAPKSTGRDDFPFSLLLASTRKRDADLVATATAITVESIGRAYEDFVLKPGKPLTRIQISGGGAKNSTLVSWLAECMGKVAVSPLSTVDVQKIEAQAFAYFGYLSLHGESLGGTWTGAKAFGPPAHLIPGKNWNTLLSKICP